ncbi:uncharacterized protein LOC102807083, partial [Saccoglossus kowalevskii]|uniref:Metal tolerance protein 4-like n=1 Tax=Saccoglossus kowalevskii TaxID=10224 RepID=A0ABM0MS44_SACKO
MSEDVTTSSEDELECRPQNIIAVIDELEEIDSLLDSVPLKTTSNGNQQPPLDAPRHGNHDISERRPLVKTTTYTSLAKLKDNQKRRQDSITDEKIVIKKNVKSFYKKQDALIKMLSDAIDQIESGLDADTSNKWIARAAALSFFMNLLLLVAKVIAAYLSGSISIISSLVDSAIDLVSGVIIFASGRSIKKTNIYKYPI